MYVSVEKVSVVVSNCVDKKKKKKRQRHGRGPSIVLLLPGVCRFFFCFFSFFGYLFSYRILSLFVTD